MRRVHLGEPLGGNSRRLLERLRDWRAEQEERNDMSSREPESPFWDRSRVVRVAAQGEGTEEGMGPVRLVDLRVSCWRWSRGRRKVATAVRLVVSGMEVRSREVMACCLVVVVVVQVTPVNEHGLWLGSQLESREGLGRVALKLISC